VTWYNILESKLSSLNLISSGRPDIRHFFLTSTIGREEGLWEQGPNIQF